MPDKRVKNGKKKMVKQIILMLESKRMIGSVEANSFFGYSELDKEQSHCNMFLAIFRTDGTDGFRGKKGI